jgi:hypothetical protein
MARCHGWEHLRGVTAADVSNGRLWWPGPRKTGSMTEILPKSLCQQTFFPLALQCRLLVAHGRGRGLPRLLCPTRYRHIPQRASFFPHGLFSRIRLGTIADYVFNDIEQCFHPFTQGRRVIQAEHEKLIFM